MSRRKPPPRPARGAGWLRRLAPHCQVCDRRLRGERILQSLTRPLGTSYPFREEDDSRHERRVRWICGSCLRRADEIRARSPGSGGPTLPARARIAIQRADIQWYAGGLEEEASRWVSSQGRAQTFTDAHEAEQVRDQLARAGFIVHTVVIFFAPP